MTADPVRPRSARPGRRWSGALLVDDVYKSRRLRLRIRDRHLRVHAKAGV